MKRLAGMKAQRFVTVTFGGVALVFGLVVLSTPGFAQAPLPTPQAPPSADQPGSKDGNREGRGK